MHAGSHCEAVYLCAQPVDFRKSIDGLSALVEQELRLNVFSPSLFVFVNRQRTKIKALYWHRNGFCLWYKRLEAERFAWPLGDANGVYKTGQSLHAVTVSLQEFAWLIEGFDLWNNRPHKTLEFASIT
jgi:transposase